MLAATLPAGFTETQYVGGLNNPTAMEFAPDGRLFILEKGGTVRVVTASGNLLPTPFVSLAVQNEGDRGLVGIAFDPNFAQNGHVYLYYTRTNGSNRLSRFTASSTNPDVVGTDTMRVLIDGLPMDTTIHTGGVLEFGADGMLYLGVGDSGVGQHAQNLGDPRGKILRINPATYPNVIPADNPFVNVGGARKEVWARGFRNPYSGAMRPGTSTLWVNDVGQETWEELNVIQKGKNYGWPAAEGNSSNTSFTNPLYAYRHEGSSAITGGAFYTAGQFPATFAGSYFFADFSEGWLRRLNPSTNAVTGFATGLQGPVDLDVGPDGSLYYLSGFAPPWVTTNRPVMRIRYTAAANRPPSAVAAADVTSGAAPLTVRFSAAASADPDGDPLSYAWNFGNGKTATGRDVTHVYTTNGTYKAKVTVSDGRGGSTVSGEVTITVGNRAPTPVIAAPLATLKYRAGDTVTFAGSATDPEQGTLAAGALHWSFLFLHAQHSHGFIDPVAGKAGGSFVIPRTGEVDPDQSYQITLRATDAGGLAGEAQVVIRPQTAVMTLASSVPGATLWLDGAPVAAGKKVTGVVGMTRTLEAPRSIVSDGLEHRFVGWLSGGQTVNPAAAFALDTPAANTTYTATYQAVPAGQQSTFGMAPIALPGVIEAEDFDLGGPGVAYADTTAANDGKAGYRATGVDLQAAVGGGFHVGWTNAGEWLEYTVSVAQAGAYELALRVSSGGVGGTLHVEFDGMDKTGPVTVPDTELWTAHQTVTRTVQLAAGLQVVRVAFDAVGETGFVGNLNWLKLTPVGTTPTPPPQSPFSGTPVALPGVIEAEAFDTGGSGVAYSDTTAGNTGKAYRTDTSVDLEVTTDAGGGYNVGYTKAGEWLEYTVNVPAAGAYLLDLRVASPVAGARVRVSFGGVDKTGPWDLPNTGGWQTWETVSVPVTLAAGQQVVRLTFERAAANGFVGNINWMRIRPPG